MKSQPYIDCHTHAHFAAFKDDYKEVIERALDNSVWVVNVGTQIDTSRRAIEVAHEFPEGVFATIGLHPTHTDKSFHDKQELALPSEAVAKEEGDNAALEFTSHGEVFDYDAYKKLAEDPRVVAIGECGLDYFRLNEDSKEKQIQAFRDQIRLAHDVQKPLMIHCRDAFDDLIKILESETEKLNEKPGIIHFFTGTKEHAEQLVEMGWYFTFGGVITFTRDYNEAINLIPMEKILSETDAPYVTPAPYRGKRNEPVYVIEVVKKLAELKGVSEEEMKNQIFENATKIFNFTVN
ncbi:MAG: hydrolase TatD [Candidatus Harrisonbacteria bacterium CG10_big_fil_rev_8_21_14_0_10_42_17]|uniref:Hydrolase TatD n=1 Tax=Candidatus Harrisonbacteria bacterium CG10_big_fil_rev_8_21_14_0_10_42_17 TaxID=1974584 RepID=A0A2M6WJA7_9BACT|nr:MAG: hydrolase TatD [Candidatus Harrisonbacteria bacterium CG10_big_fil_rev_8_21_14_0_10_42_17]